MERFCARGIDLLHFYDLELFWRCTKLLSILWCSEKWWLNSFWHCVTISAQCGTNFQYRVIFWTLMIMYQRRKMFFFLAPEFKSKYIKYIGGNCTFRRLWNNPNCTCLAYLTLQLTLTYLVNVIPETRSLYYIIPTFLCRTMLIFKTHTLAYMFRLFL